MTRMVSARELRGKCIIEFRPGYMVVNANGEQRVMHDPVIVLDDGSRLVFGAEEHPIGDFYGVFIQRVIPR